jgi:seryl-tRNA synthetase
MGRRAKEDIQVSLFPFMSILACLIGILTLMISFSMAANHKKQGMSEDEFKLAQENKRIKTLISNKKKELEKLDQTLQKDRSASLDLQKLKEMLAKLKAELAELDATKLGSPEEIQSAIEALKAETAAIKNEQPTLERRVQELKLAISKLKETPVPKEPAKIMPPPIGMKMPRNLFFVECNSTGIVIRGPKDAEQPILTAAIKESQDYALFCEKVKKLDDSMILFLVRKTGFNAYGWAAGRAEKDFEVRTSRLPIPSEGPIDLSEFRLK